MMNRLTINYILLSFLLLSGTLTAEKLPAQKFQHKSFGPGEELHYVMNYGFIRGGEGLLTVKDSVLNGRAVYHMVGKAKTAGLADKIFKVRDVYESFYDPQTRLPVKSIRNISEGRYRWYNESLFEQGEDSTRVLSQRSGEKWVVPNIYDIVSAFYIAREKHFNDNLREGQIITLQTYFADEEFPLRIRYRGLETINTHFGKLECYKFSPVTEVGRSFKTEDDMHIWITRDDNRVPVRIRFNLKVGSFVCDLEQFRGLKNPFSSFVP
ncbi:DUF3108 domain-containing protein [Geofilum rubicundum]|uniref:ATP-dependent exoDNAse alpha subunit-helicase superfamily I member n=1 Tax=Geofilum rubicundum JCM 15548 TaxID=1236989 RepID=A0A0E9LVY1_9BACT|nr:DUF3108 domain-containing protein [Geofilum rubicundum]GAO29389.1 ATP-dependent exoDNAse alpha subunit - helicase superfamily I member [Geofilum rubicundum JCM 15548]